ncbi:hypothetical protein BJ166DRAFT_591942 [Pestalotiopsis sp. NC0098]|nr:hypothetical protein BJ166DRAFT_591942 [Pestalotiopsis sp. NC0098]
MLSHLRFHRRGTSNPTSPVPENGPTWESAAAQQKPLDEGAVPVPGKEPRYSVGTSHVGHGHGSTVLSPQSSVLSSPPLSSREAPPTLPPIAGIASPGTESPIVAPEYDFKTREEPKTSQRTPYTEKSGFLGGLALQNYQREQQDAARPGPPQNSGSFGRPNVSSVTSPTDRNASVSFHSPTDQSSSGGTGKRPHGARLQTEPVGASAQNNVQEPVRDRRSIPFLKNPISNLLLRRKTSQTVLPELSLPLRRTREEPSYQPIRGTRVHDFSAPRPRRIVSSNDVASLVGEKQAAEARPPPIRETESPPQPAPPVPPKDNQASSGRPSSSIHSRTMSVDANEFSSQSSRRGKDSTRRQSSIPSSISTLSRNTSGVSSKGIKSSIPKHMKSTSSRFSFDMIGAASAEKLLEEKHRQRQQEKEAESPTSKRDSRFDDFDEDQFDYDAMDYDDGLEEAIPGVNCDYYEEEIPEVGLDPDPDDDQENFAGFVFQRSDPASSLASPLTTGLSPTPRDVDGNVIGYAMTKESPDPRTLSPTSSGGNETLRSPDSPMHESPTGLGIQGLDSAIDALEETTLQHAPYQDPAVPRHLDKDDELYFGGHDFEGEGDGNAIDESLFDLDDTDQYGRPIPGMFASALAKKMNAQEAAKPESEDMTPKTFAQPDPAEILDQSSLSAALHEKLVALEAYDEKDDEAGLVEEDTEEDVKVEEELEGPEEEALFGKVDEVHEEAEKDLPTESLQPIPDLPEANQDSMLATQAALAAAVQEAAASGKFRRIETTPPPPAQLTITSPTTSGSAGSNHNIDDAFENYDYDDDYGGNGLDDYELDDDAIIAEANASALASDDDGWYGQEFGFYSTPLSQTNRGSNVLNEADNTYGGYFGPSGVMRSKSGRVVSREPNLTPITERSEYSNRNSLMSMPLPSGGRDSLQSPGLAQLAMMADDEHMTLSSLMQLRNKAWGGSQASLASSREGSPSDRNGVTSPYGQDRDLSANGPGSGHARKNSAFSLWSMDSGAGSGQGSPTLTMAMVGVPNSTIPPLSVPSNTVPNPATSPMPAPLYSPPPPPPTGHTGFPPVIEDEETESELAPSPVIYSQPASATETMSPTVGKPSQARPGMGHRHKGSSDSISYHKEEDSGETRWVMERRRTAESGEIEILGRQVVEGGRI